MGSARTTLRTTGSNHTFTAVVLTDTGLPLFANVRTFEFTQDSIEVTAFGGPKPSFLLGAGVGTFHIDFTADTEVILVAVTITDEAGWEETRLLEAPLVVKPSDDVSITLDINMPKYKINTQYKP